MYGDSPKLPKVEHEVGEVLSPYALTKKVDEQYGKLYTKVYGLGCIGLRYFNVFGRRQDPHSQYAAVIPIFVKSLLEDKSPTIFGDGEQSRDFTYIENVIEANLKSCIAPEKACGEAFNIAYGERITINSLYEKLRKLLGKDIKPTYGPERKGDIKHSLADTSKAQKLLGYNPSYDLDEGLEMAIDWYVRYLG